MSTRSGKRIHSSLLEDTATTQQEPAVKSEKKARTKRVKENLDELSVPISKNKKRTNYVSYPTDDDLLRDTATKNEGETKPSRTLRKNALKEHNPVENNDLVEPQPEAKSHNRKSRRLKRVDDAEATENHENVPAEITEVPKSRESKKKKKVQAINQSFDNPPSEEAPAKSAKSKKKKKKKGKRTSSTIVEAVPQNDNSKNGIINRSDISVDSFRGAAGSPYKNKNIVTAPDNKVSKTVEKTEEINKPSKTKTKNYKKNSNNNTFNKKDQSVNIEIDKIDENKNNNKSNKKGKPVSEDMALSQCFVAVARHNLEKDIVNMSHLSNGVLGRRVSNTRDATFDISNISKTLEKDMQSNLNVSKVNNGQIKRRKSNIKEMEVSLPENIAEDVDNVINNDIFDKKLRKNSVIKDFTFNKSDAKIAKEIDDNNVDTDLNDSNISNKHFKTRRSMIKDSTFDKSNATFSKEIVDNNVDTDLNDSNISTKLLKIRRPMMKDSTFDKSNSTIPKEDPVVEIDLNVSKKHSARKSILKDSTFDKSSASITNVNNILKDTESDSNLSNISNKQHRRRKSNIKDSTFDKQETLLNTTFEKETDNSEETIFEKDNSTDFDAFKKGAMTRKSNIRDASFDKSNISIASLTKDDFEKDTNIISSSATKRRSIRHTFDKNDTISENAVNTTYEKTENTDNNELKRKSLRLSKTPDIQAVLNTTFEIENANEGKENLISSSKTSLISSDNSSVTDKSDISRISITTDDTSEHIENIVNTTPLLIESSIDESHVSISKPETPIPQTPLKREGTFTKDCPEVPTETELETSTKRRSIATPGCTPYHVTKTSQKNSLMNVTRSLEKVIHATLESAPRLTRVVFCSPVDNPATFTQEKKKIIKSNLKGSNKSFVLDENASLSRPGRKRSYTQNDADDSRVKRTRLTEDLQQSVDRLSRPRSGSTTVTTPKKPPPPSKPKSEVKAPRTKLPNFAALHQKQFDKMESLGECQERRAKRAKELLTPTAPPGLLERISPKNNTESPKKGSKELPKPKDKTDTPTKKLPTLESVRPGFTRFGFKLNLDVNPFSIPSKTVEKPKEKPVEKPKEKPVGKPNRIVPRLGILPSLAGATSVRREVAKLTVMREKSFTDRRNVTRNENRTVIKGVRTNRRFELQMKMRNMD